MSAQIIQFPARPTEPLVTKRTLAGHLAVSERWIEKRVKDGMPAEKFRTGAIRFRVSEVEDWLRRPR
jgi:predicted DNA-binding transcriptional regulator AlpA